MWESGDPICWTPGLEEVHVDLVQQLLEEVHPGLSVSSAAPSLPSFGHRFPSELGTVAPMGSRLLREAHFDLDGAVVEPVR